MDVIYLYRLKLAVMSNYIDGNSEDLRKNILDLFKEELIEDSLYVIEDTSLFFIMLEIETIPIEFIKMREELEELLGKKFIVYRSIQQYVHTYAELVDEIELELGMELLEG